MIGNTFNNVNGHFVVDVDEVLVRISPKWVDKMHHPDNFKYFKDYLLVSEKFNLKEHYEEVLLRTEFQLYEWMKQPNIESEFSRNELMEVKERVLSMYDDPEYYDTLLPTPLANTLVALARNKLVKKISIVSRNIFESSGASKERFLKKLFKDSMNKVDMYFIEEGEKKSDVVKDFDDVSLIFEDELKNVEDFILNCPNIKNAIICIPRYGYNMSGLDEEVLKLAEERNIDIMYFDDNLTGR